MENVAAPVKPALSDERQRKCDDYRKYAAMLEVVTGVSFDNREVREHLNYVLQLRTDTAKYNKLLTESAVFLIRLSLY